MRTIFIFVSFIFLISCGSVGEYQNNTRRDLNNYYAPAGASQYFLAELPEWANFSQVGQCRRGTTVKYLNLEKLAASYSLNYNQLIQLQYMFNKRLSEAKQKVNQGSLYAKDEEVIFYDVYERIKGGFESFAIPTYEKIHFVWIDDIVEMEDGEKKLQEIFKNESLVSGHPVFVSLCLSYDQVEKVLEKTNLTEFNIRIISAEMFSPYGSDLKLKTHFVLDFDQIFKKEQKLIIFTDRDYLPEVFQGKLEHKKF